MRIEMIRKFFNIFRSMSSCRGFTLVEVLITLVITGIIMSSVYAIYIANLRAFSADEDRVEIQQGQRFSFDFMAREMRHAGYDLAESGQPTIVAAGADYIYFTADLNNDGVLDDAGEHIVFCVYNNNNLGYFATDAAAKVNVAAIDGDNDGFSDPGHTHPAANPSHQTLSTIERLEFHYTLSDGTQTTTPSRDGVDLDMIREIDISLLSRSDNSDIRYNSSAQTFTTASGTVWNGFNDGFRRMMLVMAVRLRNMGL